mmetsp:Transcript_53027/g.67977  ORF Transcript_53027/g.67977 Transcript_53027/m.67977 type:complete len:224 (-) Transcript_53027:514-1185(-)
MWGSTGHHCTPETQPLDTSLPKVMVAALEVPGSCLTSQSRTRPWGWPESTISARASIHEFTFEVLIVQVQSCRSTSHVLIEWSHEAVAATPRVSLTHRTSETQWAWAFQVSTGAIFCKASCVDRAPVFCFFADATSAEPFCQKHNRPSQSPLSIIGVPLESSVCTVEHSMELSCARFEDSPIPIGSKETTSSLSLIRQVRRTLSWPPLTTISPQLDTVFTAPS